MQVVGFMLQVAGFRLQVGGLANKEETNNKKNKSKII